MLRVSTVRTWGYGFCMVIVPLRWVSVRARDALGFRLGRTIDASRTEQWMEGMRKKGSCPCFGSGEGVTGMGAVGVGFNLHELAGA